MTLLGTAGHLHPGGLYTDLKVTRGGRTKELFRSVAKYFEPAGAVSWDVSMTPHEAGLAGGPEGGRPPERVGHLRHEQGVLVRVDGDHGRSSYADGKAQEAKDPFKSKIDSHGLLTHGHLPENATTAASRARACRDARKLPERSLQHNVMIKGFLYGVGDFSLSGKRGRPPRGEGRPVAHVHEPRRHDRDLRRRTRPTTRSPRARRPVPAARGIAYPLADAKVQFDSGELGYGPAGFTPAANRNTW